MSANYDIRMFRNSLSSYIKQSAIEPEVKLMVLKDLTAQAEKEADTMVICEAAELQKASQPEKSAEEKESAVKKESGVKKDGN